MALGAGVVALLVGMSVPVTANHAQADSGRVIVFDHVAGNEWWVEVALSGQDAGSVAAVEAQDTNGPWTTLAKKSWGPYAASFQIEPGNQVRFRTSWAGGAQQVSCWFSHPAGAEQCAMPPPPQGWTIHSVGDGGAVSGTDLAVGDVDHDGRPEVYLANPQGLWQFTWTSNGWAKTPVNTVWGFTHVAVGDLTGDGKAELFGVHSTFENRDMVEMFTWNGQTWHVMSIGNTAFQDAKMGDLLIADVEPGGNAEIYWGETRQGGLVTQVESTPGTGWTTRHVGSTFWGAGPLTSGDTQGDGTNELYVGTGHAEHGDIIRFDITATTEQSSTIHTRGLRLVGLDSGDVDGDGRTDLVAAHAGPGSGGTSSGDVTWLRHGSPNWNAWTLALPNSARPTDVSVGDADNAGGKEIYVAANDGHLYRLRWTGTTIAQDDLVSGLVPGAGLVLGDGDGDGLREIYAAGRHTGANPVQQATNHAVPPKPAPAWHESLIGDAGGRTAEADITVGDGDRDGKSEVYVAARHGLYQFKWTGAAWQRTIISDHDFNRVVVGDGDRDGLPEVYATGPGLNYGYEVSRFVSDGAGAWSSSNVFSPGTPVGTISIGDIDDDGTKEIYVVMMPEFGGDTGSMPAYQLEFEGPNWQIHYMGSIEGGARSSWIGDADRSGDRDLYIVGAAVYRMDMTTAGVGSQMLIGDDLAGEDNWFNGIVAGDGDRDGQQEVYVGATRFHDTTDAIYRYAVRTDGWERTAIQMPQGAGPRDLALGDADNDGTTELYVSAFDGGLWQVRSTGSGWAVKSMADVGAEMGIDLALGDADGDGKVEAYMTAYDSSRSPPHNVYRLGTVPPPTQFDATFTGVRGNEWWEQVTVTAAGGTLSKVDVRVNAGAWQPLAKQSWGGYAGSYRAVQGSTVQFRATAADGATDLSSCYRWIPSSNMDAAVVTCGDPPPPPPGFDAQFSNVKGNEWWVEAKVTANQPIAGVAARINCGSDWHQLQLKSWGAWAGSFNVPAGAKVDFRARSNVGHDYSGGYIWPNATPTSAC